MLAFLGNLGTLEIVVIVVTAVLIFGKDLPQAASRAYMQVRKLRNAVDDLRRDTGIDRELRNIERSVREAEWESRRTNPTPPPEPRSTRPALPEPNPAPAPEPPAPDAGTAESPGTQDS